MPPYLLWNPALGVPPYIEQAMWPLYRAAVEAGDPGKLCPGGFLLFDDFWASSEKQQEDFRKAFMSLANAFSRSTKKKAEVGKTPEGADY
jgi:hypothetical protein